MAEVYYDRSTCRLCLSDNLQMAMPLKATPIGDKYLPPERGEETRQTIPLDLLLCRDCGHLQTGAVIYAEVIYTHYLSRPAAVNTVLSDAYRHYAENIVERYRPSKDDLIVEMGSNDGAFLSFFKERDLTVLGVDPAENLAAAATARGIETKATMFSSDVSREIRQARGTASVFIANFVYANIDHVDDVTDGIRDLLAPHGVFMFETNYRVDVFQSDLVETINHEHLSYYAVRPLKAFFARHGMELIRAERVPSKGGSIRCTVQLAGGPHEVSPTVEECIRLEEQLGLYETDFYKSCAGHIHSVRQDLNELLNDLKAQGKSFAGYGTSIGATIYIYQLDLGEYLDFLVDDDPYRQELVSPGHHIPVVSGQSLCDDKPDYVLILAPLYAESIMKKNQAYIDQGGHFIVIWPEVVIR